MPYGFGGGLAEGFGTGLNAGVNIAEVRLRREALLKEQITEQVKTVAALADANIEQITNLVTSQGQRTPALEQGVQELQGQGLDMINMLESLGTPEARQMAKHYKSVYNAVIPKLQTKAEAFTAEKTGEVAGALAFSQQGPQIFGQPGATPAAGPAPTGAPMAPQAGPPVYKGPPYTSADVADLNQPLPGAGMGSTAAAAPTPGAMPTAAPAGPAMAQAAPAGPSLSPQEMFDYALKREGGKDNKIQAVDRARISLIETGLHRMEEQLPDGRKLHEFLRDPSSWSTLQWMGVPGQMAGGDEYGRAIDGLQQIVKAAHYSLTGQAATDEETKALAVPFTPGKFDTKQRAAAKMDALYDFAGRAMTYARGNTEVMPKEAAIMYARSVAGNHGVEYAENPPSGGEGAGSSATAAPAAPERGTVEDGYRFKGGNPADPNNWEKVQ